MADDADRALRFTPLRPATRWRLIATAIIGPLLWLVALLVAAWLVDRGDAIELGLLVAIGSFVLALPVLALLRAGRRREERRYADGR
jgi:hypothetical protein